MFDTCFRTVGLGLLLGFVWPVSISAAQLSVDQQTIPGSVKVSYYSIRPDLRLCISPLCGGYWISEVNRKRTRCVEGGRQTECYVAEIDWESIGLDGTEGATLILGFQRDTEFPGFEDLAVLVPEKAWRPATDESPEGTWFGLQDNGVRCFTFPCYSIDERMLNRKRKQTISGVDLDGVSADPNDTEAAFEALVNDELIAVGENAVMPDEGPAGDGITMVATQFFLLVQDAVNPGLACETDSDCTTTVYQSFVSSPDECYCPLCPEPLAFDAARENQQSWQQNCEGFGFSVSGDIGTITCPQVLCIAPPPVACVDNQCVFLDPIPLPQ